MTIKTLNTSDERRAASDEIHTAFIALGSNLDNPLNQCNQALEKIKNIPQTELLHSSSFYKTAPLVPEGKEALDIPSYVNAVCEIKTGLTAEKLLGELLKIEKEMGRERCKKWESRLIDLDLLFFDSQVHTTEALVLPHPEIQNRSFVLEPLREIAPNWTHPKIGKTIEELLEGLKGSSKIEKINAVGTIHRVVTTSDQRSSKLLADKQATSN